MPVQTGASCLSNVACPIVSMPQTVAACIPSYSAGGINDLYFPPCTESLTETNILDTAWWTTIKTADKLGNFGVMLGSLQKKSVKTEKVGSCKTEQIVSITWAIKCTMKVFDKTSTDKTTQQINALIQRSSNFQCIARMCEGADTVLPIGPFSVSDVDWIVPESSEDIQQVTFELSWIEFAKPKTYTVAGLSAIIPKA